MNKELSSRLSTNAPLLKIPNCACGDGWYGLLNRMLHDIQGVIRSDPTARICISDIKEKYGTLRFYADFGGSETAVSYMEQIVNDGERASVFICEDCGSTLNTQVFNDGWLSTLCEVCVDRRNEINEYNNSHGN